MKNVTTATTIGIVPRSAQKTQAVNGRRVAGRRGDSR